MNRIGSRFDSVKTPMPFCSSMALLSTTTPKPRINCIAPITTWGIRAQLVVIVSHCDEAQGGVYELVSKTATNQRSRRCFVRKSNQINGFPATRSRSEAPLHTFGLHRPLYERPARMRLSHHSVGEPLKVPRNCTVLRRGQGGSSWARHEMQCPCRPTAAQLRIICDCPIVAWKNREQLVAIVPCCDVAKGGVHGLDTNMAVNWHKNVRMCSNRS